MLTKCYICDSEIYKKKGKNIFTSKTLESCTPVYKLLEDFVGNEIIVTENCMGCRDCFSKLNEYDVAFCTTQRIKTEVCQLLLQNKNEYTDSIICNENEIKNELVELINLEENGETFIIEENSKYSREKSEYLEDDYNETQFFEKESIQDEEHLAEDVENCEIVEEEFELDNQTNVTEDVNITGKTVSFEWDEKNLVETTTISIKKQPKNGKLCKICEQYFPNNKELKEHKRVEHDLKDIFVCDICGMNYKVKSALKIHIAMHNGESPYNCEICGKSFTQKGALKRHRYIHTGERPHQCEKCGKQFMHHSSFHMHNLAHNDVRNKKCEVCGLLLRSTSHLKRHMLVHTGQKPHACPVCDQRFAQRYNMLSHLRSSHQGIQRKRKPNTEDKLETDHVVMVKDYCSNKIKFEVTIEEPKEYEELDFFH